MISLNNISVYIRTAGAAVYLLGEENCRPDAKTALPGEVFARMLALAPGAGKVESLKTVQDGAVRTELFALVPKAPDYDALEELTAEIIRQLRALKADRVEILLGDTALGQLTGAFYKQLWLSGYGFDL